MKILITTDSYAPVVNGVVTSVLNLKKHLEKRGNEVKILTLSLSHKSYVEGDVTYIASVSMPKIYDNVRFAYSYSNIYIKALENWKPDIIHSQTEFSTYFIAKKIASRCKAPIIHTYHTVYEDYTHYFCPNKKLGKVIASRLTKLASGKMNTIIAPTEKVKKLLTDYGVKKDLVVIPTGIEVQKFKKVTNVDEWVEEKKKEMNIPLEKAILLFAGRIGKEKNISEILKYLKREKTGSFAFVVIGDGPYKCELEKLVSELELCDKVFFTGMIRPEEMPLYYKLGDLFVSASTSETQGLTYIEALCAGLPLLCKKDDCLNEVLVEGVNGFAFDNEDEFYEKLSNFVDKENINKFKQNALICSDKFSAEMFAQNAEKTYINAIASKKVK